METEELTKLVDGIYKNILDKFNPGARQMINAGKAYLKALHGAAAASRLYVDAITKLARQAQQGTWGGSADIVISEKLQNLQTEIPEINLLRDYWSSTYKKRRELLIKDRLSMYEYLHKFPCLSNEKFAIELLSNDFKKLFQNKAQDFLENWPRLKEKLITLISDLKNIKNLDDLTLRNLLPSVNSSTQDAILLHLMPYLTGNPYIKIPEDQQVEKVGVKRKRKLTKHRATILQNRESFFMLSATVGNIDEIVRTQKAKLLELKLPLQPLPIFIGTLSNIIDAYVIVDNLKYRLGNPIAAIDFAFKTIQTVDCQYPEASLYSWLIIQQFGYDISINETDLSMAMKILLGTALMRIVEVYKEIQEQQMNILKAFYVDMLVPLETNLEKDTKVVQSEQKRFLQQHKARSESYSKAAAAIKKQRKKTRASAGSKAAMAMDKELKTMQVLEEEKSKLDAFCEQSLKNAMTQERRRYGFVLERQCSLAKHYLSYHTNGMQIYQQNIDDWSEVAKTREFLPESVENMFSSRMRQVSFWPDEDVYSNPRSPQLDDDRLSITSQLRKTKSMDASCLDIRSIGDAGSPMLSLSRAKSEFNLTASTHSLIQDCATPQRRPKSMAVPSNQGSLQWDTQLARALYAYLSSGENQLSFLEGDVIALIGERNKGWQYGENLRTQCSGWFPLAYTEIILDDSILSPSHRMSESQASGHLTPVTPTNGSGISSANNHYSSNQEKSINENSNTRMFGDTLNLHRSLTNSKQIRRVTAAHSSCPPPSLPAPVPTPTLPFPKSSASTMPHSQSTSFNQTSYSQSNTNPSIKTSTSTFNFTTPTSGSYSTHPQGTRTTERIAQTSTAINSKTGKVGPAVGNISLHSSNDSGFSNDPPPQPEIDYSDDDITIQNSANRVPIRSSTRQKNDNNNNNTKALGNGNNVLNGNNEYPTRSGSYGTLLDQNKSNHSSSSYNNQATLMRSMRVSGSEKRGIIKRTKSFWKFGKSTENEILEGMALWKHRDLVDVQREIAKNKPKPKAHPQQNALPQNALPQNALPQNSTMDRTDRHSGSEKSNDSDRTLQNAKPSESIYLEKSEMKSNENNQVEETPIVKKKTIEGGQKTTDSDFENEFIDGIPDTEDNFFDDDGLMLRVKTVNRKNILQQYNNDDEIMSESENNDSDSVVSSDDPYDCIVVDDHTATTNDQKKNAKKQTDTKSKSKKPINKVAEIGKKLEKLAKSTKYSQKENQIRKSSDVNIERRRSLPRSSRKMSEQREHTFRTFGHDEKRRSMQEPSKREREREKRYDQNTSENIYGEGQQTENRQIIPRTKLVKSNSVGTGTHESDDNGLMEYGQSLQKRLKHPDTKYQEISPETGNMYGPWYDLWGMDSSVKNMPITKKRMSRNPREENIYGEKF